MPKVKRPAQKSTVMTTEEWADQRHDEQMKASAEYLAGRERKIDAMFDISRQPPKPEKKK